MNKKNFAMGVVPNNNTPKTSKRKKAETYFDIDGKPWYSKDELIASEIAIALSLNIGITKLIVQNRLEVISLLEALDDPIRFDELFES